MNVLYKEYAQLSRVDKPLGTYLLFIPCAWSVALTNVDFATQAYVMGLMGFGAFCMRGAGCIVNDMWDRDIDKFVSRTANRPLASGRLTMEQAKKSLQGFGAWYGVSVSFAKKCENCEFQPVQTSFFDEKTRLPFHTTSRQFLTLFCQMKSRHHTTR